MDDDRYLSHPEPAAPQPGAVGAWAAITEATTKAVAASGSLWELSDAQLVEILDAEHAAAAARDGARLAVIRELDQRGHAVASGATGTAAWLAHRLLIDPARAHHDVRAAQQLDPDADTPPPPGVLTPRLPGGTLCLAATGRALLAGDISRAHADTIAALIRSLPVPTTLGERDDLHVRAQVRRREARRRIRELERSYRVPEVHQGAEHPAAARVVSRRYEIGRRCRRCRGRA